MTTIAHLADSHICTRHKRWPTLKASLRIMVQQIWEAQPDLIVHAGDLGEPHPSGDDLYEQASFLRSLGDIAPVVVVAGNHDSIPHLHVLAQVGTRHPLRIVTAPLTLALVGTEAEADLVDMHEDINDGDPRAIIHCMPWPRKGHLLSILPALPSPEESDQVALGCLRNIFRGWRAERELWVPEVPSILLGHLDLSGARGDQGQPLCTPDVSVSVHDLATCGADATLLGHIHARQEVGGEGVWYAGSPCRLTWGEAGADSKGWGLLTLGNLLVYRKMEVPSPRLWTVDAEWTQEFGPMGESLLWDFDGYDPRSLIDAADGDELRFRYHVPEDQRVNARISLELGIQGIWPGPRESVTVEPRIIPSAHARAPEIATEEDPVAQAMEYLKLERPDLSEAQREELLPLLREAVQGVSP